MEQSLQSAASDAQLSGPLQGAVDFITSPFRALRDFAQSQLQSGLLGFLIGVGTGVLISRAI